MAFHFYSILFARSQDQHPLGIQIFDGQIDPNNESRFTITAVLTGVKCQLLGQLLPVDTIRLDFPESTKTQFKIMSNLPSEGCWVR